MNDEDKRTIYFDKLAIDKLPQPEWIPNAKWIQSLNYKLSELIDEHMSHLGDGKHAHYAAEPIWGLAEHRLVVVFKAQESAMYAKLVLAEYLAAEQIVTDDQMYHHRQVELLRLNSWLYDLHCQAGSAEAKNNQNP